MLQSQALLRSERFLALRNELVALITRASGAAGRRLDGVRDPDPERRVEYQEILRSFEVARGRELIYPFVSSGLGSGPFVELLDGSVKYDMITGIGVNFFGHAHPELLAEVIDGLPSDIMQGNLQPGVEAYQLLRSILSRVGEGCRLKHGWYATCGTMANEVALKIIRQKHAPATKILAFADCFAGRSTAMQEVTDNPKYREGQPVYGEVYHVPFYSRERGLEASARGTIQHMRYFVDRYPGKFAGLMIELVQGEGGFNYAPREFYVQVFEEARRLGLAIWVDEIQTFGRTGELFAYQTFGLHAFVDVVTVAKALQTGMILYTEEYNPRPGLIAGTFTGSISGLRAGRRVLELLDEGGYLGPQGRVARLSDHFASRLEALAAGPCQGALTEIRRIGGMIAFRPGAGTLEEVKAYLARLFDLGVVAFYCGHDPYLVRLLPPLGAMTEEDIARVCELIGKAFAPLARVAAEDDGSSGRQGPVGGQK